jgi:peroxiredoxin
MINKKTFLTIFIISDIIVVALIVFFLLKHYKAKAQETTVLESKAMIAAPVTPETKNNTVAVKETEPVSVNKEKVEVKVIAPEPQKVQNAVQKPLISDIVGSARSWGPAFQSWYGKQVPDFTLKDITGKEHKLSSYVGKNVMVVFWATWCGPCRMEVPHLKELRSQVGEDKLAILALSNEYPDEVANFASKNGINYTIFSYSDSDLKSPFNSIRAIPTTFFIDQQGKIKLASSGAMSIEEMKLILDAQ